MEFRITDVRSADAVQLIDELNRVLTDIIGNDGTAHVSLADFERPRSAFFVGYDGDSACCCAGIRTFDEYTGEIKRVYARKNTKGYAATLMEHLENWSAAQGYCRLVLECREGNPHAIDFYKRQGYTVCSPYPPYEDQRDAVCMEKTIGPQVRRETEENHE